MDAVQLHGMLESESLTEPLALETSESLPSSPLKLSGVSTSSSATNLSDNCDHKISTQLASLHHCNGLSAALEISSNGFYDTLPVSIDNFTVLI